jgi:hypothetical protein
LRGCISVKESIFIIEHSPTKKYNFFKNTKQSFLYKNKTIYLNFHQLLKLLNMSVNVPLTMYSGIGIGNYANTIVIGKARVQPPNGILHNGYWAVVVSRKDLSVLVNINFTTNSVVPSEFTGYAGNDDYILILTTLSLHSDNLPVGAFYNFLIAHGAGAELKKLEQIYAALDCGSIGSMGYSLVTVFDQTLGIENASFHGNFLLSTLQFTPFTVNNQTLYTPISL